MLVASVSVHATSFSHRNSYDSNLFAPPEVFYLIIQWLLLAGIREHAFKK